MFPSLDFAHFYDPSQREGFCRQFVSTLQEYGFVKLINHGIPDAQIDQAFAAARHFFELLVEEKLKSPHPPTANPHRGFSPVGLENVGAVSDYGSPGHSPYLKDMKESYDIGSECDPLYKNIWPPPEVDDTFQPTFTSFFEAGYRTELAILRALSIGLGLPEHWLGQLHAAQTNELRITHYPAVAREDFAHSTRIATHTDFGTITLLFQDAVGGLQVEVPPHSGQFEDIDSGGPYECILNAGDCLQMWTGLHSARHRVHLPDQFKEEQSDGMVPERFSIAYFAKPDRDAILRPLMGEDNPEGEYLTANEFQHMRIAGTY
ncbi:hypothetical protein ASPWEDRAFT_41308 [Aspergillus wentii DTO 134E9]|uniref:Fe2OG dioxygenase domain-containing protein n=1 Tax=Aspergillus wentii DTO 134E9 TaxID=1073089 RepID=A0A1L9RMA2_ASPWE|nr:uncharacterized protein ASPWEDRAFT_41308 [Aspergillus wentii DTO 134E9]OJJ36075.1 hypothetical protein ASPWEDRAFT_41308 [Aspergillus wentii DTO 134E9]